ncbi:MAG: hypothetical protein QM654_16325 [Dysgonamonadaceae bacterium]
MNNIFPNRWSNETSTRLGWCMLHPFSIARNRLRRKAVEVSIEGNEEKVME